MDPFEVRLQFISLLSRLSSSLASIQKLSSFSLIHGIKCGEDLWDCLIEECSQVNLNSRINLLYFLDTLLEKQQQETKNLDSQIYKIMIKRDLGKLVDLVVPFTKEGVLNLMSTNQVLRSWRTRRLLDADILDPILLDLEGRKASVHSAESDTSSFSTFSRNDILRRIEDDRERHKRLRERIWVLPISTSLQSSQPQPSTSTLSYPNNSTLNLNSALPSPTSPSSPSEVASYLLTRSSKTLKSTQPLSLNANSNNSMTPVVAGTGGMGPELAIEIEFDQLWDNSQEEMNLILGDHDGETMEVDDDNSGDRVKVGKIRRDEWSLSGEDVLAMRRERERCFTFLK